MRLGENIYRLRTRNNMSQGELADALEVSRQSISKWETNASTPELDKLIRLSQLFGVSLDTLVTGTEPDSAEPVLPSQPCRVLSARKIVGIIMLCLGLLMFFVTLLIGHLLGGTGIVLLSIPLIVIGFCCLAGTKRTLFVTGWLLIAAGIIPMISMVAGNASTLFYCFHLLLLLGMTIWTILKLFRSQYKLPILWRCLIALVLCIVLILWAFFVLSAFLQMDAVPNIVTDQFVTFIYD